eukprot:TRINITY_DN1537_c0_g1::TRINITY_DN1537_c0_g1_i1::g.28170::m.28170 TRINITY_DN1537_c0_g1::TRINITY_DN1537_c0_g1_i1::g.28170  ORF type:complete len:324 (+),score=52.52,sp/Q82QN1/Y474_STRAW/31.18/2e-14,LCM/PF04072.9/1.5e-32 TRINITY_DN1537_c0_g1_i1:72-1043(+)
MWSTGVILAIVAVALLQLSRKSGYRRLSNTASITAEYVCLVRYMTTYYERDPKLQNKDPLSGFFLISFVTLVRKYLFLIFGIGAAELIAPGTFGYVSARTRWLDAVVQKYGLEVEQFLLLGAGYDSRAYRMMQYFHHRTKVFEVDAPPTQAQKSSLIRAAGVDAEHVNFVPVDFLKENFMEKLIQAGFKENKKTLIIWEGVTMYLSAGAVEGTLRTLSSHCAEGSMLAFDFISRGIVDGTNCSLADKRTALAVKYFGEPFTFGLYPNEIADYLAPKGFAIDTHYDPARVEKELLVDSNGKQAHPHGLGANFVLARVDRSKLQA